MMTPIEESIILKNELDNLRPLSKEQENIIMQKLRLDWNYNSNNLEGNSLTYGETKALLLHGITAQGKPLRDHIEITGHDEAVKWIEDLVKGDYPLTENFIRELHTLLLKDPYEVKAITAEGKPTIRRITVGQYKTAPNHVQTVTGEVFHFATPEETPSKMHDLINWYRSESNSSDINPIVLAAEFHYRFIRIHPFDDGNGRIARILMNFILMKYGYPPTVIKTVDKDNYFSTLRQADGGDISPFVDYIAHNLVHSLKIMIAGAKGEVIEEDDDVLKEFALLKAKLKRKKPTKSPTLTFSTIQDFMEETYPLLQKVINQVSDIFTEATSSIAVNGVSFNDPWNFNQTNLADFANKLIGKESLTIFNINLYKDEIEVIEWQTVLHGLKGAKNESALKINIQLELNSLYPVLKLFVDSQNIIQHNFDYDLPLDYSIIEKLQKQLLKNITTAIKLMV